MRKINKTLRFNLRMIAKKSVTRGESKQSFYLIESQKFDINEYKKIKDNLFNSTRTSCKRMNHCEVS